MSPRSSIPPGELAERHELAARYEKARAKARIDDDIRGIRTAVKYLIGKEKELQEESVRLQPFLPHQDKSEEA